MDEETVAIVRALVNNKNTSTNERPRFFLSWHVAGLLALMSASSQLLDILHFLERWLKQPFVAY